MPSADPAGHHRGAGAREAGAATTTTVPAESGPRKAKKQKLAGAVGSPGGPSDSGGGYPLTPFVLIVILLFLAGLAARYAPRLHPFRR